MTQETEHNGVVAVEAAEASKGAPARICRGVVEYVRADIVAAQGQYIAQLEAERHAASEGSQPMTDHKDARQLLADITAGLEGVTPGPWAVDGWCTDAVIFMPAGEQHVSKWKRLMRCAEGLDNWKELTSHVARCDPATMQTIDREFTALSLELAAANQRIAELEAERQWQPIETLSPKNGTIAVGWGEYRERDGFSPAFMRWYATTEAWSVNGMPFYPTHWMPLPASPHEGTQS